MPVTIYKRETEDLPFAKQVLQIMGEISQDYVNNSLVVKWCIANIGTAPTIAEIFTALKNRIPYVPDPTQPEPMEDIRSPLRTVANGEGGDCDDMATAAASVLQSYGYFCMFRAIKWRIDNFTHVYTLVSINGKKNWVPFDLTLENAGDEINWNVALDYSPVTKSFTLSQKENNMIRRIDDCQDYSLINDLPQPTPADQLFYFLKFGNTAQKIEASKYLHSVDPVNNTKYLTAIARDASVSGYSVPASFGPLQGRTLADLSAGPSAGTALAIGAAAIIAGALLTPAAGAAVSAAGGLFTSGSASSNGDPNNPGRSLTDARTYMDQLTQTYPSQFPPVGSVALNEPSVIIYVPNLPQVDQNTFRDYPSRHIFASWDGGGSWITDQTGLKFDPSTGSLTLSGGTGFTGTLPGCYVESDFNDGTRRFDFLGLNASPISSTAGTQQVNTNKNTVLLNQAGSATAGQSASTSNQTASGTGVTQTGPGNTSVTPSGSSQGNTITVASIIAKLQSGQTLTQAEINFISTNPTLLAMYAQYAGGATGGGQNTKTGGGASLQTGNLFGLTPTTLAIIGGGVLLLVVLMKS